MILSISFPASASIEVNGFYYDVDEENMTATFVAGVQKYTGKVTIPASVSYKGKIYSVTAVGDCVFRGCSGLTSVTIGKSLNIIYNMPFDGCESLVSLSVQAKTPPTCYNALDGINKSNCDLYVPSGSLSAYNRPME